MPDCALLLCCQLNDIDLKPKIMHRLINQIKVLPVLAQAIWITLFANLLLNAVILRAQERTQPHFSGIQYVEDVIGGQVNWTDEYHTAADDDLSANVILEEGEKSNYLVLTGFNFDLPEGTIVNGVEISMKRSVSGGYIRDNMIRLVKNGQVSGHNRASSFAWPDNDSIRVYGTAGDLWGNEFTTADINAPDFGVAISLWRYNGGALFDTAFIDFIQITIYYNSVLLSVDMTEFSANSSGGTVKLEWATATEKENDYFAIERSADGTDFEVIGRIDGRGTAGSFTDYSFIDTQPRAGTSFYRLRQTDFSGVVTYSALVSVLHKKSANRHKFLAYPNPVAPGQVLYINNDFAGTSTILLRDLSGKTIYRSIGNAVDLPAGLKPGMYIATWIAENGHAEQIKVLITRTTVI